MRALAIIACTLLAVGCPLDSCDNPMSSDGANTDTGSSNEPVVTSDSYPAPERADRRPNIHNLHIFTFFSATITYDAELGYGDAQAFESQYIVRVIREMMTKGFNTGRIGAQTDGWCDNYAFYLPCGPPALTPEWEKNLVGMLELTARIPGFQLQLIPTFTHKGDDCGKQCLVALTKEVVRIVKRGKYKHVIWEAFNEFWHPSTYDGDNDSDFWWQKTHGNLTSDVLTAVMAELPHPRGTDFPDNHKDGEDWRGNPRDPIGRRAKNMMDYMAFHPSRNPEPTVRAYLESMNSWPRTVIFDETVSWISIGEQGMVNRNSALFTHGTEAEMRKQVTNQQHALCSAGATCSFHALWLFSYDERIDWAPQCPCN